MLLNLKLPVRLGVCNFIIDFNIKETEDCGKKTVVSNKSKTSALERKNDN